MEYIFSLGSNIGDREKFIEKGVKFLSGLGKFITGSSIYETSPVGMLAETRSFYNSIVVIDSEISPSDMLTKIKDFENSNDRDTESSHNLPRTIDIDILFTDNIILDSPKLTIPHKKIEERKFILIPLSEIRPDFIHPASGKTISDMLNELESDEKVANTTGI